jgi:phenylacetate-CoA ligase
MTNLIKLYHRLPPPLRNLAASARGYYLNWWRYGKETETLVAEALERERWSAERLKNWQEERLAYILEKAAKDVPYYRDHWARRRQAGDRSAVDQLKNWPILKKTDVRQNPQAFISDDCDPRRMYQEHTSGSTGTPVELWFSREALFSWFSLFEARWRRWHGVTRSHRWGMIGGQQVTPFEQTKPPFWIWNAAFHQLYMSTLHIRPDFLSHYLKAIEQYSLDYLYGYASGIYWLSLQAAQENVQIPMTVVLTDAEPLYDWQRVVIEKAFACPVRETYGQAEMVCAAGECEHGKMHIWPEIGFNEVVDEAGQLVAPGVVGRLIGTSLTNGNMPLIRYDTTDMAKFAAPNFSCKCGRNLPVVEKIIGRSEDFIVTPDGRRVMLIDIIFSPDMHLLEAQIIQEKINKFKVKVVPTAEWGDADVERICSSIRRRVGNVDVIVDTVPSIERTWSGKFKVMVSKLPPPDIKP